MAHYDLPIEQLRTYNPPLAEPDDLDDFWASTLAESRALGFDVQLTTVDSPYTGLRIFDVTFSGFGGDPIKGWLHLPKEPSGPLPAIVEYIGYGGGRGLPHQGMGFAVAGYAHLIMDNRGMGFGGWSGGTPDPHVEAGLNHAPGMMTLGILSPQTYYFRRIMTDAVLAVDALSSLDEVNAERVAVGGGSMGGGLALIASALNPSVRAALVDVPFLCNIPRAIRLVDSNPYHEIAFYLSRNRENGPAAESTLRYFDAATMASRASAPALFSVGLMDTVCPPSTVYTAYNRYGGPKSMVEYAFNDHEGGQEHHDLRRLEWLASHLS
jgi:cephalosporin-C deacetylase